MSRGTAARHCAFGRNLHSKCSKCSSSRPYENILGVSWKVRMQTPQAHAHCTSSKGDKSNCARNSAFRYPTALRSAPRPAARADFSNGQDPFTPPPTYNELAASALAGERPLLSRPSITFTIFRFASCSHHSRHLRRWSCKTKTQKCNPRSVFSRSEIPCLYGSG